MEKLVILFLILFLVYSCGNEDPEIVKDPEELTQLEIDIAIINDYLLSNNLTALSTESGLHYSINEQGNGSYPTVNSLVEVQYKGSLISGYEFDNNTTKGSLKAYIKGWQEGLSYFKEGGKGILLIPSELGYGANDYYSIPGNSVLIFDIVLLDVID